jgi:large conductance mechanosensitive channel
MGMMKEFKQFAMKGNLVDIAVAFVMGAAFGRVVSSFIDGIVMPVVGKLTAGTDFSALKIILSEAQLDDAGNVLIAEASINYGAFIAVLIDFILVAMFMFFLIRAMNRMKKKEEAAPAAPPAPSNEEKLLVEIRDLLKK